jgi:hypothetical protein
MLYRPAPAKAPARRRLTIRDLGIVSIRVFSLPCCLELPNTVCLGGNSSLVLGFHNSSNSALAAGRLSSARPPPLYKDP